MSPTDQEITKLCADATGITLQLIAEPEFHFSDCPYYVIPTMSEAPNPRYDPLHNDEQALALVKRFHLQINVWNGDASWVVYYSLTIRAFSDDLNRAICECVAKMQKERT